MKVAHIGLGKTGTSFIQRHFFNRLTTNFYTTDNKNWPDEFKFIWKTNETWLWELYCGNSINSNMSRMKKFEAFISRNKNDFISAMEKFRKKTNQSDYILSAEGLSGVSHEMLEIHLDLLRAAGVEKIIFICRNQSNWATSLWRQFLLSEDRFARFVDFDTLFGNGSSKGIISLDWNMYVQKMDYHFGRDNVLVLPYELLISNPVDFFHRVSSFLGYKETFIPKNLEKRENPSCIDQSYLGLKSDNVFPFNKLPKLRRKIHRLSNVLPKKLLGGILKLHPMSLDSEALKIFQGQFFSCNGKLETRIGISLKTFGYY